jgi:hypothetical protein
MLAKIEEMSRIGHHKPAQTQATGAKKQTTTPLPDVSFEQILQQARGLEIRK